MADVNRGSRPLSPHLTIYRRQLGSAMSIFHRITGMALALPAALLVWWFLAAATGRGFASIDGLLTSWFGELVLIGSLAALWYHFFNGIRHLAWDVGLGFGLDEARRTGLAVFAATVVMSVITLVAAL